LDVTGYRIGLVLLQSAGALSIVPWPAILVASVMSLAAYRAPDAPRFTATSILFLLAPLYPALFFWLYMSSWRALGAGAVSRAFTLSTIPLILCLVAAGAWYLSERTPRDGGTVAQEIRAKIAPVNPLVWTLLCAGGSRRLPRPPLVTVEQALLAIQASNKLNVPAPPYGTPLQTALANLCYGFDGSPCDGRQQDLARLVSALVARGARLSELESGEIENVWRLRLSKFEGPVTTGMENPLTWRIVKQAAGDQGLTLGDRDIPLLNLPSRLHGTPLFAALLTRQNALAADLVKKGARLSPEEEDNPAIVKALQALAYQFEGVQSIYPM
jgi:hypothetical protein